MTSCGESATNERYDRKDISSHSKSFSKASIEILSQKSELRRNYTPKWFLWGLVTGTLPESSSRLRGGILYETFLVLKEGNIAIVFENVWYELDIFLCRAMCVEVADQIEGF